MDLNLHKVSNYGAIMKKYNLICIILWKKHMLQIVFRNKVITKFS